MSVCMEAPELHRSFRAAGPERQSVAYRGGVEGEEKQRERERVADFIFANHDYGRRLRLLSFPSREWRFERMVAESWHGGSSFLGVECDWGTIEQSVPWMPGKFQGYHTHQLRCGGELVEAVSTHARCFWSYASAYLSFTTRNVVARGKQAKISKVSRWKRRSAIWLDFTSPLCGEVVASLERVGSYCSMDLESVPFAITVAAAREPKRYSAGLDESGHAGRVAAIAAALDKSYWRTPLICDWWTYKSRSMPMLTVVGKLVPSHRR